ncbi:MAG: guanitoxin biosynthesis pre-guanitoxin forming N-methyltransferase GntF [Cyanobacteria bacterium J06626_26]
MQTTEQTTDVAYTQYQDFDSRAYLKEYYSGIIVDEQWLLEFLVEHLGKSSGVSTALDCGSGPVVSHLTPLAAKAQEIHVAEYLHVNRAEISMWLDQHPDAYEWQTFTKEILRLEGQASDSSAIDQREQLTRDRVTQVLPFDVRDKQPLGGKNSRQYPLVTAHYCADCVSPAPSKWHEYASHIMSLVESGGKLIMSTSGSNTSSKTGTFYRVVDQYFPQTQVTPQDVLSCLRDNGFENLDMRVRQLPDSEEQGYDCLIFTCATKR